jgi:hypothetical protein
MSLARLADSYKLDTAKLAQVARPDILANLQRLLVSQQTQPALITPNTFTLCLHILVVLASNSTSISLQLLRQVSLYFKLSYPLYHGYQGTGTIPTNFFVDWDSEKSPLGRYSEAL